MAVHISARESALSRFTVVFVFCALLTAAPLQGTDLSGTLTDPALSRIAGATINLYTSTALVRSATTSGAGTYSFAGLPPGAYVLECFRDGFQKQSRRVVLGESSQTEDFTLDVAGLHEHVSVVASNLPEMPREISKSVSLITAEEIAHRNPIFLSDALSSIPALQLQQLGGPGTVASYRFRGLRPEDSAIFLDGFRYQDAADNRGSARPFLSDLLLTGADRIEVLRGAGSTLYGTNAIGGLINDSSAQPSGPPAGYLSFEGGTLGLLRGAAGVGGSAASERLSYGLDLAHVNYTKGEDGNDDYRITGGAGRAGYQLTPKLALFTKFAMSDSFALLNQDPSPLPNLPPLPDGEFVYEAIPHPNSRATFYTQLDDPDYRQGNRSVLGALRLDHQASAFWSHTLGYQSLRTRRHYDDGPGLSALAVSRGYDPLSSTGPRSYDGSLDELFWRNRLELRDWDSAQVHLRWERTALDQTEFGQTTEAAQRAFSIHLQNQLRLLDGRLQVELAGQAQYYDLDIPKFSDSTGNPYGSVGKIDAPSAYHADGAVAYFIAESGTKLRLHAGNGFRSPSLYERFGSGGSGFYYGNPQLKPERAAFVDGGLDQYLLGDRLQLSATYFYTRLRTIIDFGSTPNDAFGRFFGYLNAKGALARGVELSFTARPGSRLSLAGSYTYNNSDQPAPTSAGTTRVLGISNHQFTFSADVRPLRRLNLHWQTYAVTDYDFPLFGAQFPFPFGTYRFPGYVRADLTASLLVHESERGSLHWLARVDNLLNREYYHGGFVAPKAVLRSGIRWEFYSR